MEDSNKQLKVFIIFISYIIIFSSFCFIVLIKKLNTIDQKLDKILQEQVMTNKYLYN